MKKNKPEHTSTTLKGLRQRAQNLSQSWAANPPEAHAALLNAWCLVLERIRLEGKDMDLSGINILSGILQRLITCQKQLNELVGRSEDTGPRTLDAAALAQLEALLHML